MIRSRDLLPTLLCIAALGGCVLGSSSTDGTNPGPEEVENELTLESHGFQLDLESPIPFQVFDEEGDEADGGVGVVTEALVVGTDDRTRTSTNSYPP